MQRNKSGLAGLGAGVVFWTLVCIASNICPSRSETSPSPATWTKYNNPGLGINFAIPRGWTATVGCHDSRHCLALSHGNAGVDDYTLALEVFAGPLEQVATNQTIFRHEGSTWVAGGRGVDHPAAAIAGPGWHGIEAVVDCGASDSTGFHAAGGECLWAVLSDGRRSIVADTQGTVPVTDELRAIIQSVRFVGH
jgi:hypothetical protein